jgi:hypothetical protein
MILSIQGQAIRAVQTGETKHYTLTGQLNSQPEHQHKIIKKGSRNISRHENKDSHTLNVIKIFGQNKTGVT